MPYVDYIIVGGGISGSVLSYTLMKHGASVHLFDVPNENMSSKVAAGLWNPIVLKRMKKVWMADKMMEVLHEVYPDMEAWTHTSFFEPLPLRRVFHNPGEQNTWMELSDQQSFAPFLQDSIEPTPSAIIAEYGSGLTKGTGRLQVNTMMTAVREKLRETKSFTEEYFNWEAVEPHSEGVQYKDIRAHAIISCEGTQMALGKSQLNQHGFSPVKGEILTVQLNRDLGKECIHQGHFMLGEEDQKATIGATYAWEGFEDGPTPKAKEELIQHIEKVWSEEYRVIGHSAGTRPATKDRRPIIGPHPVKENVWVFNGMGSRAVLMAPYLAQNLTEHLLYGVPLLKECDPARFER